VSDYPQHEKFTKALAQPQDGVLNKQFACPECGKRYFTNCSHPCIVCLVWTVPVAFDQSHYKFAPCECGHAYYRHFDTYDNMRAVGCKYCDCFIPVDAPESA